MINLTYAGSGAAMPQTLLTANSVFTMAASPVAQATCTLTLVGDGTHTPDLTAFTNCNGYTYNSANGARNVLTFAYFGGTPAFAGVAGFQGPTATAAAATLTSPSLASATKGTSASYSSGTYSGAPAPTLASIQWTRDGTAISGATSATYTPVSADVGHLLRATETYTNSTGSVTGISNSVTVALPLPVFSAQSAPAGTVGVAYSYTEVASDAASYSVVSGSLPAGTTLNTSTGVISGTPTTAASSTFVIGATNATGTTNSSSQTVVIAAAASGFSDNFNRANASTLGSPWVQSGGTMSIVNNKAMATGNAGAIAIVETGLANSTITVTPSCDTTGGFVSGQTGSQFGIYFRYVDANNYWRWTCFGNWYSELDKCVGGVSSNVTSGGNTVTPDVQKLQVITSGSSITLKVDTGSGLTTVLSATDSALSTATKAGLLINMTQNQYFDDFSAV